MSDFWSWERSRETYTDWASVWGDDSGIKKQLQWRGFPLWWSSNLIAKDTHSDYFWYEELHSRLAGNAEKTFQKQSDIVVLGLILLSLFQYVAKWALVNLFLHNNYCGSNQKNSIWFHSLEYNLIYHSDKCHDRMYESAPLSDVRNGYKSKYILRLNFHKQDIFHPWRWREKINKYPTLLQRDVDILDKYLTIKNILSIHISLIANYFKFIIFSRSLQREGIKIGGANFFDIYYYEMQKSFAKIIPWSLCYGSMFEKWFSTQFDAKLTITYGETLAPMRPVYFFSSLAIPKPSFIAIQHATIYKNKMGFYHRHSEFNMVQGREKFGISPAPDFYFVHGSQFMNILSEFYPADKVRIIGCLKNDSLFHMANKESEDKTRLDIKKCILLLAPSVGDEDSFLSKFVGLNLPDNIKVVLSKHPSVSFEKINEVISKIRLNFPIEINSSKSTAEVMNDSFLVACSYSGIALDALLLGVPAVRVLDDVRPPVIDDDEGILRVSSTDDLLRIVCSAFDGKFFEDNPDCAETLQKFFYAFDGGTTSRFWKELKALE